MLNTIKKNGKTYGIIPTEFEVLPCTGYGINKYKVVVGGLALQVFPSMARANAFGRAYLAGSAELVYYASAHLIAVLDTQTAGDDAPAESDILKILGFLPA